MYPKYVCNSLFKTVPEALTTTLVSQSTRHYNPYITNDIWSSTWILHERPARALGFGVRSSWRWNFDYIPHLQDDEVFVNFSFCATSLITSSYFPLHVPRNACMQSTRVHTEERACVGTGYRKAQAPRQPGNPASHKHAGIRVLPGTHATGNDPLSKLVRSI